MINDDELRPSVVVADDGAEGAHFCHFYESEAELLDTVLPYLKTGLDNHQFCMWVVPASLTTATAVQALAEVVPDAYQRLADGDIEIVSHWDWYLSEDPFNGSGVVERWKAKVGEASTRGYTSVRITGDVAWVDAELWKDFSEYESSISEALAGLGVTALCT